MDQTKLESANVKHMLSMCPFSACIHPLKPVYWKLNCCAMLTIREKNKNAYTTRQF